MTSRSRRSTCSTTSPRSSRTTRTRAARRTPPQFAIQKSKIVAAINALDADIVALQEIENSPKLGEAPDEALADLVAGLNAAAGSRVWDYVPTPAALHDAAITDFITNAIIYKRGRREALGRRR